MTVLVTGAGGFIGGHLVKKLRETGESIRAVDVKPIALWYQKFDDVENIEGDLRNPSVAEKVIHGREVVYNLAADMGGMGFIENNRALCMLSVLINSNLLNASLKVDLKRYFYSSSACVYASQHQTSLDVVPLKESDAYPAMPEDGYGWEKLFSERMCRHFQEDFGIETRVARYHNVYGPFGSFEGGREKAPAAICRKVAFAKLTGQEEIEVWGDGEQKRSFMWIEDCIRGTLDICAGSLREPVNLGSGHTVSINQLIDITEKVAGIKLRRNYNLNAPQGVRGRSSDNRFFEENFGWQPCTSLESGIEKTYAWIYSQMALKNL